MILTWCKFFNKPVTINSLLHSVAILFIYCCVLIGRLQMINKGYEINKLFKQVGYNMQDTAVVEFH